MKLETPNLNEQKRVRGWVVHTAEQTKAAVTETVLDKPDAPATTDLVSPAPETASISEIATEVFEHQSQFNPDVM